MKRKTVFRGQMVSMTLEISTTKNKNKAQQFSRSVAHKHFISPKFMFEKLALIVSTVLVLNSYKSLVSIFGVLLEVL